VARRKTQDKKKQRRRSRAKRVHHPDPRDQFTEGFHVMAKPAGPLCNLRCEYCFYTEKEALFPQVQEYRMSDEVLTAYTRSYINSQNGPEVTFAWQGGEPTLLGIDFFRNAIRFQEQYRGAKRIKNTLQTNGVLLDDEWCEFLARHEFLIGLSLDGPQDIHDRYRLDRGGRGTFENVMKGLELLKKHRVDFNILTCVTRESSSRGMDVYRFLKDQGVEYIQFIPVVERTANSRAEQLGLQLATPPATNGLTPDVNVTGWTVEPETYGDFLTGIFDEWVRNDVGSVFVMTFEWALASWMGVPTYACTFSPWCGRAIVIEHNGDVYSCDHYVYPDYHLGNILNGDLKEMVDSPRQVAFGKEKETSLPGYCRKCEVLSACRGGCPKHRFLMTPDGRPGLNYLCAGHRRFFQHISPHLRVMADLIRRGEPVSKIMDSPVVPLG
jgi:uncharacterized protein